MSAGGDARGPFTEASAEKSGDALRAGVEDTAARPRIDSYEDLRDRIDTIKGEVDALQIGMGPKDRPWKRLEVMVPIVVSVAALVFTIVSSAAADERIARQDEHAARAELRGIIQRLQALPKERFEVSRVYASDAVARQYLGGQITGESILLAQQAAALIDQLDGEVGAQEYADTAFALAEGGQWTRAETLLTRGLAYATDALSEAVLLRQLGTGRFNAGDLEGGRAAFAQALRVFDKYSDRNAAFVATTQAYTESFWAQSEAGQGQCAEAWKHLTAAETAAADFNELAAAWIQVQTTTTQVQAACGQRPS